MGAVSRILLALSAVVLCRADELCPTMCECQVRHAQVTTDCSSSNLTSLPDELDPATTVLDLSDNRMTEIDYSASWPAELKALQLSGNLIKTINSSILDSSSLEHLDLSDNEISAIDPEAFLSNENLTTLLLQGNPLDTVKNNLLVSPSLKVLDLKDCGLMNLSNNFFGGLTTLRSLDLSDNPLSTIESHLFASLPDLHNLKLSGCNLSFIDTSAFAKLTSLRSLDLSRNSLGPMVEWSFLFDKVILLEELNLTDAGITHLPEDIFSTNTLLRRLVLAENELSGTNISTTLGKNLRHLHFLDLSNCRLNSLSKTAFENATKLATLILSGNRLKAGDLEEALLPLVNLQMLSLKNCSLTGLPNQTFHKLSSLQILDISHNPLNESDLSYSDIFTSMLNPLSRLKHLDMSYSRLHHINESTFSKMTSLNKLILSGNPLKTIDPGLFNSLIHLKVLEMNDCGLTSLTSTVFLENISYPELEELHLSKNPLIVPEEGTFLPLQLSGLHKLDLSNCGILKFPTTVFKQFSNLTWLSLAGNKLGEESLDFLNHLEELKVLDLSRNNLKTISPSMVQANRKLKELRLGGNPWRCNCFIVNMWKWANRNDSNILAVQKGSPLVCEFHWTGPPGRRPSSGTVSWGRYTRDPEGCSKTS